MARPIKKGIDYFSFDVDFFEDEKIEPISGEFGIKGEIIVIRLLCAVYRNGYFAIWNEQLKMTLANRCKVSFELIEQVVSRLVKWGFFDEYLFNSAKVITSKGIQKRFQEATRKRKYNYSTFEFWLINNKKDVYSANNPDSRGFLPPKTPQSKVKEIKEKEINKEKDFSIEIAGEQKAILSSLYPFLEDMLKDQLYIERLCMNNHLTPIQLSDCMKSFFVLRSNENNDEIQTVKDAQTYFARWLNNKLNDRKGGNNAEKTAVYVIPD